MSKLSSDLPGEAPDRPIMVAGSNCGWEFMDECGEGEGELDVEIELEVCSLGGSTCLFFRMLLLVRVLSLFLLVSSGLRLFSRVLETQWGQIAASI